jgi:hypothetical protein
MVVCENNGKEEGDVDMILGGFDVGIDEREKNEEEEEEEVEVERNKTYMYRTSNIPVKHDITTRQLHTIIHSCIQPPMPRYKREKNKRIQSRCTTLAPKHITQPYDSHNDPSGHPPPSAISSNQPRYPKH